MTMTRATVPYAAIPGPTGHPLLGMVPAARRDLLGMLLDNFHEYGDVVSYRFGARRAPCRLSQTTVAVHHPDVVRRVFTDGRLFSRRTSAFAVLSEMMGNGLLTADGEVWLRQRRTLQPLFTPR